MLVSFLPPLRHRLRPTMSTAAAAAAASAATTCFLRCREKRHEPIQLLTTECNYLGRTPTTQIKDIFCSRQQVSLDQVDLVRKSARLRQVGGNPAGLNGFALVADKEYTVHHGDIVEVLLGKYMYEVSFEEAAAATATKKQSKSEANPKVASSATPPVAEKSKSKRSRRETEDEDNKSAATEASSKAPKEPSKKPRTRSSEKKSTPSSSSAASSSSGATPPAAAAATSDTWDSVSSGQLLIFTGRGVRSSQRIAGYDLDGTIIRTKSGNVFPKNADDWQIAFAEVPGKLKSLHADGFKIVFFTNQAGIGTGKTDATEWRQKCENIVRKLGVPVQVFVATAPSIFRKPKTAMWDTLKTQRNGGLKVDRQRSFFVGDAAGRPALGKRKKDHSLADRLFALNVGVPFHTPEEHFQGVAKEKFEPPEFLPSEAMKTAAAAVVFEPSDTEASLRKADAGPQVVVMVGAPGSGKSHIARTVLEPLGFEVINQDTLKTWQKCVAALESALRQKRSAVIDNTNLDVESRLRYVQVAKKMGVRCRCFVMTTSMAQSKHNIAFRELVDAQHSKIPDRLLVGMMNRRKEPQTSEGFADVVRVNCVPKFSSKQNEQLYRMFLVEK